MNKSYVGSVDIYRELGRGSSSCVYMCDFKESLFAYKKFFNTKISSNMVEKLQALTRYYYDTNYVFPYELVYKKLSDGSDKVEGYVMDFQFDYNTLDNLYLKDSSLRNKKIDILKQCREKIELLHNKYNIIHCDLYPGNFLYNESLNDVKIIDFDSCVDLKNKSKYDENLVNILASIYIRNYGVDKDVDIFLFNLCTFAIMNGYEFNQCVPEMMVGNYGEFTSGKPKEILDNYKKIGMTKTIKKEYIIDYI